MSLRKIGKITGLHGLKGEVFVHVFSKDVSWIDSLKEVVLEDSKEQRKSFKVEGLRPYKEGFLAFLEGIQDRTAAEKIRSHFVLVSADLFKSDSGDSFFYLSEIEGFKVFDKNTYLGMIVGFGSNTAQDLIIVQLTHQKVEIPLVEDFLESIEFEKGEVHMKLPAGLIDIQLNLNQKLKT